MFRMEPEFYSVKQATNMVKDPTTYSMITYVWVSLLSAWGGVIRYLNSIKGQDISLRTIIFDLCLSCSTSIFAGIITFYLCEASNFEPLWTAVCVAVAGHMGGESLTFFRAVARRRMGGDINLEDKK